MVTATVDTAATAVDVSLRVIDVAMGLAVQGVISARDALSLGCMTPECLTLTTLLRVADVAGIDARELLGGA